MSWQVICLELFDTVDHEDVHTLLAVFICFCMLDICLLCHKYEWWCFGLLLQRHMNVRLRKHLVFVRISGENGTFLRHIFSTFRTIFSTLKLEKLALYHLLFWSPHWIMIIAICWCQLISKLKVSGCFEIALSHLWAFVLSVISYTDFLAYMAVLFIFNNF